MQTDPVAKLPRVVNVALAVTLGVALVGYLIGTRPMTRPVLGAAPPPASAASNALPGHTYLDLRSRRFGPYTEVRSDLQDLQRALPAASAPVVRNDAQHLEALADRARRRAYEGAPPVVPHRIDEQSASACLACHRHGLVVEGRVARAISHPEYASCTQCHVTDEPQFAKPPAPDNAFAGHHPDRPTDRAWPTSPPLIPHTTRMRDNCASCHGVAGLPGLRTTHPERGSCTQCHVPRQDHAPWGAP